MKNTVKIDAKKLGLKENLTLIDSPKNIKIVGNYYSKILNIFAEDENDSDDESITVPVVKNTLQTTEIVLEALTELLGLTKTESQKLEELSFGYMIDIFNDMLKICLGIDMGISSDDEKESEEDPK